MFNEFPKEHLELLKRHLLSENAHNLDATLATLTEDCFFEDLPSGSTWKGHAGAAHYYRTWWEAFETKVTTEVRHFPASDLAIVETKWVGRHVGQFWNMEPTGREIEIPVVIFVKIKDGLMAGERFIWDRATLFTQLGVGFEMGRSI